MPTSYFLFVLKQASLLWIVEPEPNIKWYSALFRNTFKIETINSKRNDIKNLSYIRIWTIALRILFAEFHTAHFASLIEVHVDNIYKIEDADVIQGKLSNVFA